MGGFFEGFYWESGVLEFLAKHEENLTIYTSSVGSLRGLFYSMYGENFFGRLKDFINKKNNPIKDIISSFELYNNLYAQTTALIRLGRGKMSLYEPQILKEFLKDYFGKDTLKSLNKDINFEVFELKSKKVVNLDKNTSIVDMLMMELAFPPYYPYYLYEEGYFIPSSFLSLIPQKFSSDSLIISFDSNLDYPIPKNTVEILLKVSYSRSLKNYQILTEKFTKIEPKKNLTSYFDMSAFFDGQSRIKEWWDNK